MVPPPLSSKEAIDPEEALVASASSCHMLWFLYAAAKRGFVVDEYVDDGSATMGKNGKGKPRCSRFGSRFSVWVRGSLFRAWNDEHRTCERKNQQLNVEQERGTWNSERGTSYRQSPAETKAPQ